MVASSAWTSSSVNPTPLSCTRITPSTSTRTVAGAAGSAARRAVIASQAFCSSSLT